ncbi:MAG: CBS domain-containing protein [Candidatus Thermoplasmatota archaeon]|nr:CBS domain-containing protein [Candidatus Thermoplasmatota archaeon]
MIEPVTKLPVRDAIVRPPVTVDQEMDVSKAAELMRTVDVGSLMVVDKGKMIGILTEGDILSKVVSKDKQPSKVKVKEIMSRPVVCIEPDMDIVEAAKKMAKLKIRRLPVIEKGEIIGIVSERDIIRLSPVLIDITRECAIINRPQEPYDGKIEPAEEEYVPGKCEECGRRSEKLKETEGKLICKKCIEG